MTKPELAGDGLGLELRRLLLREREAPEQPVVQRGVQSAGPTRSAAGAPQSSGPACSSGRLGSASAGRLP
eukprot:2186108-Alexandrium_andersonii.AAC.1